MMQAGSIMSVSENVDEHAVKRAKLMDHGDDTPEAKPNSFKGFQVMKVLNENSQRKVIFVHGRFADSEDDAVAILEKTPFNEAIAKDMLSGRSSTKTILQNNIYSTYDMQPKSELNGIKATLIYPATEKHIAKYSVKEMCMLTETARDYADITLPYLQSEQFSLQWVYNILNGESESERVIYNDPDDEIGFVLLPDMKWDGRQTSELYLVAIARKHGLLSLRQLSTQHLPLLNNIRKASQNAIEQKYGVPARKLRAYIHYQPSYYHLHVHFTHVCFDAPGNTAGRAHLLNDVIDNITADPTFYQTRMLTFLASETDALYEKFAAANRV